MIITKTRFQLYLIKLNLYAVNEIEWGIEGFKTVLSRLGECPKDSDFTTVSKDGFGYYHVFLSFQDMRENELIKNKFFQ